MRACCIGVSSTALAKRSSDSSATPRKGWLAERSRAARVAGADTGYTCGDYLTSVAAAALQRVNLG